MNTTTHFGGGTAPLALNHESVVHDAAADSASLRKPSASRIVTEASGAASLASVPPPSPQNQHVGAAASSSIGSSSCARAWATRCLNGESGRFPPKIRLRPRDRLRRGAHGVQLRRGLVGGRRGGGPRAGRVVALHGVGRDQRAPGPGQAALRGQARPRDEAARVRALVVQAVALHLMNLSSRARLSHRPRRSAFRPARARKGHSPDSPCAASQPHARVPQRSFFQDKFQQRSRRGNRPPAQRHPPFSNRHLRPSNLQSTHPRRPIFQVVCGPRDRSARDRRPGLGRRDPPRLLGEPPAATGRPLYASPGF